MRDIEFFMSVRGGGTKVLEKKGVVLHRRNSWLVSDIYFRGGPILGYEYEASHN